MAKLSAHGYEVARTVIKRWRATSEFDRSLGAGEVARYEYHYSFRSDGHIMRRIVGLDVHPNSTGAARRHDWGWKVWKVLVDPKRDTVARMRAIAQAQADEAGDRVVSVKGLAA